MVDFPRDESLMPAGLDAWPFAVQDCPAKSGWLVREERLERRLGVTHFRLPPDHRDEGGIANRDIPFVRFPCWHYCHQCGGMELLSLYEAGRVRCCGRNYTQKSCQTRSQNRRPFLIPVRFVAVCDRGHIQDFPFMQWLHKDKPYDESHKLRLRAGRSSAGLSGITIECSVDTAGDGKNLIPCCSRNLGDVFRFEDNKGGPLAKINCNCTGLRPWLGDASEPCGGFLRVLQRGASNVYFPHVMSSIYIPLWAEDVSSEISAVLEDTRFWQVLTQGLSNGLVSSDRCEMVAELTCVDPVALQKAAQCKLESKVSTVDNVIAGDEESFRRSEYQAISDGKVGPNTELYVESAKITEYANDVRRFFSKIQLVHKLRETRALIGFTRVIPPDGDPKSPRLQHLQLSNAIRWLPAIRVFGEGVFLDVNSEELDLWLERPAVNERVKALTAHYNAIRTDRLQPFRSIGPKFILLHTLAHVLINQLAFDCGYGSASLRERLYCDITEAEKPMQGILIYTASGDSEGTMGGLVRQGRSGRFELTLRRALNHAAWCSSDPVCIETTGQGADSANLAACHGCCLLPETSCEEGNRLLDRALLIGTPSDKSIGFFSDLIG